SDDVLAKMAASVGARDGDVVCFGHTHKPWQRTVDGVLFVNTGSVGRPKDGDPRAGYVILDAGAARIAAEVIRVGYNVEEAAAGILASTLPHDFADYLRTGGAR
ncbi:MAG: metallophosphoesterase family protein, partial [Gemmatimonadaceae bacterium]